jgi:putative phosphoribosyl transferase
VAPLAAVESEVTVAIAGVELDATVAVPEGAAGIVVFAHGSGSGRASPRNRFVAERLVDAGFGALLLDLLTATEERHDRDTAELRFDIDRLAARLLGAIDWLAERKPPRALPVGCYGASTGAAAALVAAAERPERVAAVVSRGGRPDLAKAALERVGAPTLLIVGGDDQLVLDLNTEAAELMRVPATIEVVPGAGHLFEEPGALERVAELTLEWFRAHLPVRENP